MIFKAYKWGCDKFDDFIFEAHDIMFLLLKRNGVSCACSGELGVDRLDQKSKEFVRYVSGIAGLITSFVFARGIVVHVIF